MSSLVELKMPIQLIGESIKDAGILHWFIERFILFRLQYFKNNPRSNYLLIKAVGTILVIFFLAIFLSLAIYHALPVSVRPEVDICQYLKGNFYKILTGLIGAISLVYWQTAKMFQKKWLYCSELYNKIISINPKESEKIYRILSNALTIDLVILDLWAHRSFQELFRDELISALKENHQTSEYESNLIKINNGKFSEKDALEVLQKHQYNLLDVEEKSD